MEPRIQYAKTSDGVSIAYCAMGEGTPLVYMPAQISHVQLEWQNPDVRRWYARMLLDRDAPGDRDKARELLTEAIAMYRGIGMPKHVEMAETLLREV